MVSDTEEGEAERREKVKEDAFFMLAQRRKDEISDELKRYRQQGRIWRAVRHTTFAVIAAAALGLGILNFSHTPTTVPDLRSAISTTIGPPSYETSRRESAPEAAISDQVRSRLAEILREGKSSLSEHTIEIALGLVWGKLLARNDDEKKFLDCINEVLTTAAIALGIELEQTNYTLYKEQFLRDHVDGEINKCIEILKKK
jgi:hypothetical protein